MSPLAHGPITQQRRALALARLSTVERPAQAVRVERLGSVRPVRLRRFGREVLLVLVFFVVVIVIFVQILSSLESAPVPYTP